MDQNDPGIDLMQSPLSGIATVRGTVVHDPEKAFGAAIRLRRDHLVYQSAEWLDSGRRFTTSHHIASANIPSGQILEGAATLVFVLDAGIAGPASIKRLALPAEAVSLEAK